MHSVKLEIANCVFEIKTVYLRKYDVFTDFLTDKPADAHIDISEGDIMQVRRSFENVYGHRTDWNGYYEFFAIQRQIANALVDYNTILIHGAVIAVKDNAFLFTAPSGIGKTTHIRKWLANIPEAFVVNGDKSFIKVDEEKNVWAFGAPWAGKENMYTNTMVPLKSIILMERSENNQIKRIAFSEAIFFLLQQTYRPKDENKLRKTIKLLQRLNDQVSLWGFKCNNFKEDCFSIAFNALMRNQK